MSREVTLSVDGAPTRCAPSATTVRSVLDDEGIYLRPHDIVVPSPDSAVDDGTMISVRYGRPLDARDRRGRAHLLDHRDQRWPPLSTSSASGSPERSSRPAGAPRSTAQGMALQITTPKTLTVKLGRARATPVVLAASRCA